MSLDPYHLLKERTFPGTPGGHPLQDMAASGSAGRDRLFVGWLRRFAGRRVRGALFAVVVLALLSGGAQLYFNSKTVCWTANRLVPPLGLPVPTTVCAPDNILTQR